METIHKDKIVIFESPLKTIILFSLCILFVFGSLLTDLRTEKPIIFWFNIVLFGIGGLIGIVKFLDPRHTYISPKSKLGKQLLAERHQEELKTLGDFSYNNKGFTIDLNGEIKNYTWQEIKSVFAYKRDDYTVDTISLDIYFENKDCLTITEDTPGWYQFNNQLSEQVPIDKSWQLNITHPAFDTNLTLLYDKQNRQLEEVKKEYFK